MSSTATTKMLFSTREVLGHARPSANLTPFAVAFKQNIALSRNVAFSATTQNTLLEMTLASSLGTVVFMSSILDAANIAATLSAS